MAVAVVMEFEGSSLDEYDNVLEILGLESGGRGMPGGLFHWVTQTPKGIRVTDVWESREQFEQFAQDKMVPATMKAGVQGAPEISYLDVHSYLTAG